MKILWEDVLYDVMMWRGRVESCSWLSSAGWIDIFPVSHHLEEVFRVCWSIAGNLPPSPDGIFNADKYISHQY